MNYYEVLVPTKNKTNKLLTYISEDALKTHQIVEVPLRQHLCLGLIMQKIPAQKIPPALKKKCKRIDKISPYQLPKSLVEALLNLAKISTLSLSDIAKLLLSNAVIKPTFVEKAVETTTYLKKPHLTQAQNKIYQQLSKNKAQQPQLLLGINASGKTRVYAELIEDQLKIGRSILILVPEIGLSAQVVQALQGYLSSPIDHWHSKLTKGQKKALWGKCQLSNKPLIVVGPRSAEFLPFKDLGLIILDEFHDDSFKQEKQPAYQSLQLASQLAKSYKAKLICGSATPRVEDYYYFKKAQYPVHYLDKKALSSVTEPEITIIDKKELKNNFSQQALEEIKTSLKNGYQVLIFYNRRGHWRIAKCGQCFWQAECPNCLRNLVFHKDKFRLICHGCGYSSNPISACPSCYQSIQYAYPGLKAITNELTTHLLESNLKATIWRFDSDNSKEETLAKKFNEIKNKKNLVILGTQIIGQGLDLPNLQTVVILDADQSLISPDYRSQEKYYQHIHQLSGRVGRGHLKVTKIIIQTFQPDNSILKYALKQTWLKFYQQEIKLRSKYKLPPFIHLANISIRCASQAKTKKTALELHEELSLKFKKIKFYQPSPALQEKHPQYWEWLIHASCQQRRPLIELAIYFKDKEHFLNLDPVQLFSGGN